MSYCQLLMIKKHASLKNKTKNMCADCPVPSLIRPQDLPIVLGMQAANWSRNVYAFYCVSQASCTWGET